MLNMFLKGYPLEAHKNRELSGIDLVTLLFR